jgi:hypothetical protein
MNNKTKNNDKTIKDAVLNGPHDVTYKERDFPEIQQSMFCLQNKWVQNVSLTNRKCWSKYCPEYL